MDGLVLEIWRFRNINYNKNNNLHARDCPNVLDDFVIMHIIKTRLYFQPLTTRMNNNY